jgi:aminopeptidase N
MASTTAAAAVADKQQAPPIETFRSDYKPSDFFISDIFLSFQLDTHESIVTTTSHLTRSISPASKEADLVLDGEDLDLMQIKIGGSIISPEVYTYENYVFLTLLYPLLG